MGYKKTSLTTVDQLKKSAEKTKTEIDALTLAQEVLASRLDAQVTATTEPDADYAAEVVDGRVDTWANEHSSLGANIRDGQTRLAHGLRLVQESHQEQIDALAESMLEEVVSVAETLETRRLEISNEEEARIESDDILQRQINTLSNALLNIVLIISELREKSRNQEE